MLQRSETFTVPLPHLLYLGLVPVENVSGPPNSCPPETLEWNLI